MEASLIGDSTRNQRSGLSQTIADGVGELGIEQELLGSLVEFCATNAEESHTTTKDLVESLTSNAVQQLLDGSERVDGVHQRIGSKATIDLRTENLLDNQRYRQHNGRAHTLEGGHQCRCRWRTVEVGHRRTISKWIDHTNRALVGVSQRQYREEDILLHHREEFVYQLNLLADSAVGKHNTLRLRSGARGVDYSGKLVALGSAL